MNPTCIVYFRFRNSKGYKNITNHIERGQEHNYTDIKITSILSPVCTTDWTDDNGKRKLIEYEIAPLKMASGESGIPPICP